ncbi:hypothetical protein N7481_003023 [Penicillium waksmanii]|uniref:uncharacterized protein n=1 Tax=Penicillium waksmanii TaxID=69791 RepID=UPI0025469879|nr:uncharacterized protein N7481_003023 [Penicillium waksmanii]KAJ5987813.1 hypothetical protein N7481_003023 [Penicillium waksmanii]
MSNSGGALYGRRVRKFPYGTTRKWFSVAWRQGHPDFPSNSRFSPSCIVSRSPVPITLRIAVRSLPTLSRHSLPRAAFIATKFLTSSSPDKMSYIARRGLSTLIPPKIASPNAIGAAQDAARMERVVNFYAGLPRGPAPQVKATGLIGRYKARYFDQNSGVPIVHAIAGILILGYSMEYYFHLRHHKNHPH